MEKRINESTDSPLVAQLNKILADNFVLYVKAAGFHWNIEGANFLQYHEFLGELYAQVYGTIDRLAEELRALKVYAPFSMSNILSHASLSEATGVTTSPGSMWSVLLSDIEKNTESLVEGVKLADAAGEVGLSNYFQDLVDANKKLAWMLRSISKG